MPGVFDIDPREIAQLNAVQFVALLRKLIYDEAASNEVLARGVRVSTAITVPDGGEDGRVKWEGLPTSTNYFPAHDCLFQFKTSNMNATACGREVLVTDGSSAKAKVKEIVKPDGAYVLVCSRNIRDKDGCEASIRQAFEAVGETHHNDVQITILDGNDIANWASNVPAAAAFVRNTLGLVHADLAEDWKTWSGADSHQNAYQSSDALAAYIDTIRGDLSTPKTIMRVVGLSGLGKTRLALEAFRPPGSPQDNAWQQVLSERVVYCSGPSERLREYVRAIAISGEPAVFVVDDCSDDEHRRLKRLIQRTNSRSSLLTLDHVPEAVPASGDLLISLEKQPDAVIEGIVRQTHAHLNDNALRRICEYASGFPQVAVLLADSAIGEGEINPNIDLGSDFTQRLLFGRNNEDERTLQLMQAMSVFDYVGFGPEVRDQFAFVVANVCVANFEGADAAEEQLRRHRMFRRGLVQPRGRYVQVTPYPLAVALAREWWSAASAVRVNALLTGTLPEPLVESMCRRLRLMDVVERARELVQELCGVDGPFGTRDRILGEVSSRLIEAMAEVSPFTVAETLDRTLSCLPLSEREDLEGRARRNLVGTLERLAWWPECFAIAARLLLDFAEAENEKYANNATELFVQLFRPGLSGTKTPFPERTLVLDSALASGVARRQVLALKALEGWFSAGYWYRMGGAEQQGSRAPMQDWYPSSYEDWENGRQYALTAASRLSGRSDDVGKAARDLLNTAVFRLLYHDRLAGIRQIVSNVSAALGRPWSEIRRTLEFELNRGEDQLSPEAQALAESLIAEIGPQDARSKLEEFVAKGGFNRMKRDESGRYIHLDEVRARELATELAGSPAELIDNADVLLVGSQTLAGPFGFTFGERIENPTAILRKLLARYVELGRDDSNPSLLMGIIGALDVRSPDDARQVLDEVASDPQLVSLLPVLTRSVRCTRADLDRLVAHFNAGNIPLQQVWGCPNGVLLKEMPPDVMMTYLDSLAALGSEGRLFSLDAYHFYLHNNPTVLDTLRVSVKTLLSSEGLMLDVIQRGDILEHGFEWLLEKSLKEEPVDSEFVQRMVARFAEATTSDDVRLDSQFLVPVITSILRADQDLVLPMLLDLFDAQPTLFYAISFSLHDGFGTTDPGLLAIVDSEVLLALMDQSVERARTILRLVPAMATETCSDATYPGWSTIAIAGLNRYGSDGEVRHSLDQSLLSMTWSGSAVPGYKHRLAACRQLRTHPNQDVQKWAGDLAKYFESRIEQELKHDEERDAGIH